MTNEKIELKEIKNYHKNGKISSHYFVNEKRELHGVFKGYYESGELMFEGNYENGKLHNICKWYHQNGKLWREWNLENF